MTDVPSDQQGYPGQESPRSDKSEFNKQRFMVEQMTARMSTATLVQVKKVTNKGEVEKTGFVDVLPLVNMIDGLGKTFKHGVVHNIPYFRIQGGASKAIIMDPKVGDIGVAIFADRDISSVKRNRKQSPPGSFRRFDMADGLFFPCFLGDKPTCYVRFTDDDKIIASPDDNKTTITIEKDKITMETETLAVYVQKTRIDLGKLNAPHAVMTADGPSEKVFAVIGESK